MGLLRTSFSAAAIVIALSMPAGALTPHQENVLAAMDLRIDELSVSIADLQDDLATATGREKGQIMSEIRMQTARQRQLVSFKRIVPQWPDRRLAQLISKFQLSVSPA